MRLHTLGRMLTGRRGRAARGSRRSARRATALRLTSLEPRTLLSISIVVDYSYDVDNFFNTQPKRDLMQQAANTLAAALNDNLAAINPAGVDTWSATFPDPATGVLRAVPNLNVPAATMILYVGGGHLAGATEAGLGSTGGYTASGDQNWLNTVAARGQVGALVTPATDFGPWGGSISFDDSGSTNWYFGQSVAGLTGAQTDFLSVAEHEVGHVLGIGTTSSWSDKVSGGAFHGANADAAFGAAVPVNATGDHWANGTRSDGANALMDPVLTNGTRVQPTSLDFGALKDIGWQVQATATVLQFSAATYAATDGQTGFTVTVTRSGGSGPVTVNFATADGTARAGVDFSGVAGTLSFAPGDTAKTFNIPVLNDASIDGPETVNLGLGAPTGGAVLGGQATAVLVLYDRAPADFDPDGRSDLGVFRPATAQWFIDRSTAGPILPYPSFGAANYSDIPVVGDFEGIGRAELAIFRPSTAQWVVDGPNGVRFLGSFGAPNLVDIPVPGDYDGVGHAELAVFRPSTAQWFVLGPNGGHLVGSFGAPNLVDIPVPGDYDGVGHTEPAVFRPSTAQWFVLGPTGGRLLGSFGAPNLFDVPAPGDYDATGHTELAVFRPSTAQWFALGPGGGHLLGSYGDPAHNDLAVEAPIGSLVRLGGAGRISGKSFSRGVGGGRSGALPTGTGLGGSVLVTGSAPVSAPMTIAGVEPPPSALPARVAPRRRPTGSLDAWLTALERLDAETWGGPAQE